MICEARVYPTTKGEWCLRWRSSVMPAPSYWYFTTETEATDAMNRLTFIRRQENVQWCSGGGQRVASNAEQTSCPVCHKTVRVIGGRIAVHFQEEESC